jgi:hypothetical protein
MQILLLLVLAAAGAFALRAWTRRSTRKQLLAAPLTDSQRALVADEVPLTRKLPHELRARLEGKINAFLHQIEFIGASGVQVTDAMRLSIAAQACLLVVNRETWYDHLRTIIIYPAAFTSRRAERHGYVVTESDTTRLGESWARGPVVLSWADSERGARDDTDGHNVVFHEFAHQIDGLTGHTDGVPPFAPGQRLSDWERVFLTAYDRHHDNLRAGRPTVLDPYGASAHEEFFAVAVEVFFERPAALKAENPEVYQQLAELFRLDPAAWGPPDGRPG